MIAKVVKGGNISSTLMARLCRACLYLLCTMLLLSATPADAADPAPLALYLDSTDKEAYILIDGTLRNIPMEAKLDNSSTVNVFQNLYLNSSSIDFNYPANRTFAGVSSAPLPIGQPLPAEANIVYLQDYVILNNLPALANGVTIPEVPSNLGGKIEGKIGYNPDNDKLSFVGSMSEHDKKVLLGLSADELYQNAIRNLFFVTGYFLKDTMPWYNNNETRWIDTFRPYNEQEGYMFGFNIIKPGKNTGHVALYLPLSIFSNKYFLAAQNYAAWNIVYRDYCFFIHYNQWNQYFIKHGYYSQYPFFGKNTCATYKKSLKDRIIAAKSVFDSLPVDVVDFKNISSEYLTGKKVTPQYIATWVNLKAANNFADVFGVWSRSNSKGRSWLLRTIADKLRLYISKDGIETKTFVSVTGLKARKWYFVEVWMNGSDIGIMINRNTNMSAEMSTSGKPFAADAALVAGGGKSVGDYFYGRIGPTAMYSSVPTYRARDSLYNGGLPLRYSNNPPSNGLIHWWDMSEKPGEPRIDSVGGNNLFDNNTSTPVGRTWF